LIVCSSRHDDRVVADLVKKEEEMTKKLLFGLLILALVAVPLLATACEEEVTPPAEEEEEQPPAEEEEEVVEGPEYGGTITLRATDIMTTDFDVSGLITEQNSYWYDSMWNMDMAVDRDIWSFTTNMVPPEEYTIGNLAKSWELGADGQTITVHLREGVYWQDKPPVNGREFTAYDVQAHYERNWENPLWAAIGQLGKWESVTALGTYTVEFKFKTPGATWFALAADPIPVNSFEAPEFAALSEEEQLDWHNAVGTGPWILTDYVSGTSMTFSANPNYWGYDERYPENQLPYADTLEILVIQDASTAVTALRTGQLDILGAKTSFAEPALTWQQKQTIEESNPELQWGTLLGQGPAVDLRCDTAPFTDIRVRQALQMAINRPLIAQSIYGGTIDGTPCGFVNPLLTGYAYDYADWSQELKDEYAYNVEGAKALLAEAAANGVFTPNELGGFDTNIICSSASNLEVLQVIQSQFNDIGVVMNINDYDPTTFDAMVSSGEFDQMVYASCAYDTYPTLIGHRWSGNTSSNYTYNNDAVYDQIYDEFWATTDPAEAMLLMQEGDKRAIEQHWSVNLFPTATYIAWQPYLKGYSGEARLFFGGQWLLAHLWIDQALKESLGR
jgi:peptide/nickel transport system substrate-binding protein